MLRIAVVLALLSFPLVAQVHRHGRLERAFETTEDYGNPLTDVEVVVEFIGPGGAYQEALAFWDGGRTWRVRFSPELTGPWSFRTRCSNRSDRGLHRQGGAFRVKEYDGDNPLYLHGGPRLAENRRHLAHADGLPWFWLSDTAWNGALLSTDEEWERYVGTRAAGKFSAVQFVMTQWRAGRADEDGRVAFTGTDSIAVNPEFFQRMDKKFDGLNDAGLVAAPVLLWALTSRDNESPGESLNGPQAALLASYMVARYGAYHVIWILGGDGDYGGGNAPRWREIGRSVFPPSRPRRPVTLHPRGMQDPWAAFAGERWVDLFLYQTGHGNNAKKWRWNATSGPADGWKLSPPRPVIDAEPNYEGHLDYHKREVITEIAVRRAAYYSLLSALPAGVSYGAHGVWSWSRTLAPPLDHERTGVAEPWQECLEYPGGQQMKVLREFFDSIEWWKLRPDRSLLAQDTDDPEFLRYAMPARAEDGTFAVIYLPDNPSGKLDLSAFQRAVSGTWVDPRTGKRTSAGEWEPARGIEWQTPFEGDWLLLLR